MVSFCADAKKKPSPIHRMPIVCKKYKEYDSISQSAFQWWYKLIYRFLIPAHNQFGMNYFLVIKKY